MDEFSERASEGADGGAPSAESREEMSRPSTERLTADERPSAADRSARKRRTFLTRFIGHPVVGTLIYVYFGLFIAFHVVLSVQFFLRILHPVIGIGAWIILMILGGLCVVALSIWRPYITTIWGDNERTTSDSD